MDGLNAARTALEAKSDAWATALEWATAIVALGVIVEVVATLLEVREETRAGHRIKVHHVLTFCGSIAIALAVAWEGIAEYKGAAIETRLRADNALAQSILNDRSTTAITDVVLTLAKFGGLDKFVRDNTARVKKDVAYLEAAKARADASIKALNGATDRINQRLAPRHLSDRQIRAFVSELGGKNLLVRFVVQQELTAQRFRDELLRGFTHVPGFRFDPHFVDADLGEILPGPKLCLYVPGGAVEGPALENDPMYRALVKANLLACVLPQPKTRMTWTEHPRLLPADAYILYVGQQSWQ